MTDAEETARAFKTAWFAKAARKALIDDAELCEAIAEVRKGQADDLGGAYLLAKKDRANIDDDELKAFRKLADLCAAKTDVEIGKELEAKELVEICNDRDA